MQDLSFAPPSRHGADPDALIMDRVLDVLRLVDAAKELAFKARTPRMA